MFKSIFGRTALVAALIAACAVIFGGCVFSDPFGSFFDSHFDGSAPRTDMRESVSEGFFKLTIHTEKDEYVKGEAIDCWAELEYIGDKGSIPVYCYDKPIELSMTSEKVNYSSSSGFFMKQKTLMLRKGEPIRITLAESIPKSKSALPGTYQIEAYSHLGLSPDDAVTYNAYVSAVIVVK